MGSWSCAPGNRRGCCVRGTFASWCWSTATGWGSPPSVTRFRTCGLSASKVWPGWIARMNRSGKRPFTSSRTYPRQRWGLGRRVRNRGFQERVASQLWQVLPTNASTVGIGTPWTRRLTRLTQCWTRRSSTTSRIFGGACIFTMRLTTTAILYSKFEGFSWGLHSITLSSRRFRWGGERLEPCRVSRPVPWW